MGLQIFVHSLRLVFSHFTVAFRISLPVIVAIAFGGVVGAILAYDIAQFRNGYLTPSNVAAVAAIFLVGLVAGLWSAVAWHRYVLLDEEPGAVLPPLHGDRILAYLGSSLLVGILVFVAAMLIGVVTGIVSAATGGALPVVFAMSIILLAVAVVISYRLSPALVAAAIGERLGIGAAWAATKGATGPILVLAILTIIGSVLIDLPLYLLPNNSLGAILALVWSSGTSWVKLMAGISILTTLYGHYVEGRSLPGA